jgi:hypothetical protein
MPDPVLTARPGDATFDLGVDNREAYNVSDVDRVGRAGM